MEKIFRTSLVIIYCKKFNTVGTFEFSSGLFFKRSFENL